MKKRDSQLGWQIGDIPSASLLRVKKSGVKV